MVRHSLVAILAVLFAAPAIAGPLSTNHVNKEAIVIDPHIPPGRAPCVEGQPCWRGSQAKPKNLSGPRDKRGPAAAYKGSKNNGAVGRNLPFSPMGNEAWLDGAEEEDSIYDEPGRGYANGHEDHYTDKNPDEGYKGYYWGGSDAQEKCNCLACHTECAGCASSGPNIAARSERDQTVLSAGTPPSTAAIAKGPKYAAVCVVTQLSQMCIAAGNAVCSPTGILDTKDPRCARACNCVRI